ncbi:MAG: class I SAM-dependent methyltransferase [Terriglobales bacterium]
MATGRGVPCETLRTGNRVLDIATGTGDQAIMAATRVGPTSAVLATDIAESMVAVAAEVAREAGRRNITTAAVLDAQQIDRAPDTFDAVISRNGLIFIPDLHEALIGIRRVLKTGGWLAAIVWSTPERDPVFALPIRIMSRYGALPQMVPGQTGPFALSDPATLAEAYRKAGFQDVLVVAAALTYRFASVAEFMQSRRGESARLLQAIMEKLSETDRARMRSEMEVQLRQFEGPDGFVAPGECLIAVGTK